MAAVALPNSGPAAPLNPPGSSSSSGQRPGTAHPTEGVPEVRPDNTDPAGIQVQVQEATPLEEKRERFEDVESPPNTTAAGPLPPPPPPPPPEFNNPQRPPIRPNPGIRSKFELEPNPFEQSFSRSSHHSQSSISDRTTPPRGGDATSIKHNALPPLSSLTSPAAADPTQFPWLATQSLRTGPLSPAMLTGPQNGNPHHHHVNNPSHLRSGASGENGGNTEGGFDSNAFRTGFTPGTGSGFTPGYAALMGGNFSNLPMPSPNTAAFLNMVTNSTPGADGGPNQSMPPPPHDGQQHHPPTAIPPHMQHHGLSHIHGHSDVQQDTITPNTLSALTGVFNDMNHANSGSGHPSQPPYFNQGMHGHNGHKGHNGHGGHGQQQPIQQSMPPQVDYAQQSANAASQAANGLFLLSQAHHELSKREEADGRQSTPLMSKKMSIGAAPPGSGKPVMVTGGGGGQKRKSDASLTGKPSGPTTKKGKKGPVSTTPDKDFMAKMESASPTFSMGSDEEDEDGKLVDKNETEEDKRKNFLERNRQAALKCRQRKKAWLNELQGKVEQVTMENERLQQTVQSLHDEVGRLSSIILQHRDCGLGIPPPGYGRPIR